MKSHEESLKVIKSHQESSRVIKSHQESSRIIKNHQESSKVIKSLETGKKIEQAKVDLAKVVDDKVDKKLNPLLARLDNLEKEQEVFKKADQDLLQQQRIIRDGGDLPFGQATSSASSSAPSGSTGQSTNTRPDQNSNKRPYESDFPELSKTQNPNV